MSDDSNQVTTALVQLAGAVTALTTATTSSLDHATAVARLQEGHKSLEAGVERVKEEAEAARQRVKEEAAIALARVEADAAAAQVLLAKAGSNTAELLTAATLHTEQLSTIKERQAGQDKVLEALSGRMVMVEGFQGRTMAWAGGAAFAASLLGQWLPKLLHATGTP